MVDTLLDSRIKIGHASDRYAVVPVVWTGSGKNKLRPVAG
jgi:hypothetical protein